MTRYSAEPRIFVKDYGFLPFARNITKNIGESLSEKYSQKLLDNAKESTTDALLQKKQLR